MPTLRLDGRPAAYMEAGGSAATPLLCVHGLTGSKEDYAAVVDPLAADRRVIAVDLPGHGGSDGPDDPSAYALPDVARWVLTAADALALDEFHLLGHSHGGLVAQQVAATASHRVRALVLNATGLGAVREGVAERYVRMAVAARDEGLDAAYEASLQGEEADDDARAAFARLEPSAVVGGVRNLLAARPLNAFLRGIDLPVLVVHGSDDDVWGPSEQRLLAATVRGAHRVEIAGAGHSVHADRPDEWLAAVVPFLRGADAHP